MTAFFTTALRVSGVFVLCFAVGVGIWFYTHQRPVEPLDVTVGLKWLNQAQFAGMYVALERGYYEKYGLTVHLQEFTDGTLPLNDVKNNVTQFAYMSGNEALNAYTNGEDIRVLAAIYQVSPFAVVSLAEKHITMPEDLRGKVLGTKGGYGAESDAVYRILLASAGMTTNDVVLKYLPFGTTEYQDLLDGKADAMGLYRTDQLYYFLKNSRQYSLLQPENHGSVEYDDVIIATNDFLEQHPIAAQNFLRATQEGWEYAIAHEEEAIDDTMKYVTSSVYQDRDYETFIFEKSIPLIQPSSATEIGSMNRENWERYCSRLVQLSLMKHSCDLREMFSSISL